MRLESLGQRHDAQIAKQWAVSLINHRSEKLATQNETAVRDRYAGLTWLDYQTVPVSHAHGQVGTEQKQFIQVQAAVQALGLNPRYWVIAKVETDTRWLMANPYLALSFGTEFHIRANAVTIDHFYFPVQGADDLPRRALAGDLLEAIMLSPLGTDAAVVPAISTDAPIFPEALVHLLTLNQLMTLEISDATGARYINTLSAVAPRVGFIPVEQTLDFTPLAEAVKARAGRGKRAKVIAGLLTAAGLHTADWLVRKSRSTYTWQLFNPYIGRHVTVVLDRGDIPRIYKYQVLNGKRQMTDVTTHYLLEAALLAPF